MCVCVCMRAQLYPPLCDPLDYSPPGSSVHEIFQARILEWVAMPSSNSPTLTTCVCVSLCSTPGTVFVLLVLDLTKYNKLDGLYLAKLNHQLHSFMDLFM